MRTRLVASTRRAVASRAAASTLRSCRPALPAAAASSASASAFSFLPITSSVVNHSVCAPSQPPSRSFASSSKPPKRASKLVGAELERQVLELNGWQKTIEREVPSLVKTYTFDDFNACWSVMTRVALLAEKMNHHPKWTNVYGTLKVELQTHDVGGISDYDIYMAKELDSYAAAAMKGR